MRALDVLTLALALVAVAVLVGGRWRFSILGIDIRIKTWWRPFAWSFGTAVLRHWLVRQPTLLALLASDYRRVRASLRSNTGWASAFAAVVVPAVFSRAMVYCVGLFALAAIGLPGATPNGPPPPVDLISRWDAGWYIDIAQHGYFYRANPIRESSVVFFPAFPFLMRGGAWLTGAAVGHVGLAISMLAFACGLAYVYRIARDQFRLEAPEAALSFLAWYPFAIWFGAVYTESLLLLAVAGAFYHARARQRLPAAAWAFVASLTKPNGFVVAVPLATIYAIHLFRQSSGGWRVWRDARALKAAAGDALVLLAPAIGVAAYSLYIWRLTGDPLAWLHGQQAWDRVFRTPAELVANLELRLARGLVAAIMEEPFDVLNAAAVIFALASVVPVSLRLGLAEGLLILCMIVPPLLAGGTTSMARFSSCLFPTFLWLAAVVPARLRTPLTALFAGGEGLCAALFLTWRHLV